MPDPKMKPKLIVGVGASAGGIQACNALLEAVPAESGLAFIVVLHLDPSHASHIAEILQTPPKQVMVTQVQATTRLEANHAYVISPNSKLQLTDGFLKVEPLAENEVRARLVDYLFTSLAESESSHAAGIVLSGAGQDGTEGLRRIKAAGGLTIAQDPSTASSSSMPKSASEAGVVDAVLTTGNMPAALAEFAAGGRRRMTDPSMPAPEDTAEPTDGAQGFERILEQLGTLAGVSFDDYKVGTLERRTRRRMHLKEINEWEDYADHLAGDREELEALYHDVLIGVTEFFREPAAWDQLATELPALLEERKEPGVRAWVPGCATGEEAYTLAMLLYEQLSPRHRGKIQIYATDLNQRALSAARRGSYTPETVERVTEERRQQYFHYRNGHLQIGRRIRDCVTFAPHDVMGDAPFSKMDIVCCRNLLIYLKTNAHDRLLKRLHFALRPGGLLILGRAETLGRAAALYEQISSHHSIFRARDVPQTEHFRVQARSAQQQPERKPAAAQPPAASPRPREPGPDRRIEQFVLRECTPACVVLNPDLEIQHFYGQTQDYLVPPTGESRRDLVAWLRPGFYIRLRSALNEAADSAGPLTTEGQIDRDGQTRRVRCTVEPIAAAVGIEGLMLVTFQDLGESTLDKVAAAEAHEPLVRELEQELADTRRELQSTIEQLETASEEHHASNEEMQSLNEELQSSNEELEASKEELEALNEETNTINQELEEKNTELRAANADLHNVFLSTGIPTVFLDRNLCIRRFTSAATEIMRLVPSDVGRSIEHIKERFDDGRTPAKSRQVLSTLEPDSTEVRTEDERYYVRDITPYRTEDGDIEGICITFTDVTEQKHAAQVSEAARAYSEAIINTVRTPLLLLDETLCIISYNPAFHNAFGANEELLGQPLAAIRNLQWHIPNLEEALQPVVAEGKDVNDLEINNQDREILLNARSITRGEASAYVVLSFEDVTQHRAARRQSEHRAEELKQDAQRKDEWIAMLGHELRNPIGAIGNAVELLKSDALPPERRTRTLELIQRQVQQCARLLNDLLDAGRIISGKMYIDHQRVDLARIGELALDSVGELIKDKRLETVVSLPPPGSCWVDGDPARLNQVLGNLLANAAKYTEPGGRITLEATADAETATIRVHDTGMGMSSALQGHIFEMFTQGPRQLDRPEQGIGLGLPVVIAIVELHRGAVEAYSAGEGQGSEFKVVLPRLQHRENTGAEATEAHEPAPKRRILIAEDEPGARESLEQLLQLDGHETRTVADGYEALEAAPAFDPEIALIDIGLPRMDGYELARRLREASPGASLIAITGYQSDADKLEAAGFAHHVIKPINLNHLRALLA